MSEAGADASRADTYLRNLALESNAMTKLDRLDSYLTQKGVGHLMSTSFNNYNIEGDNVATSTEEFLSWNDKRHQLKVNAFIKDRAIFVGACKTVLDSSFKSLFESRKELDSLLPYQVWE